MLYTRGNAYSSYIINMEFQSSMQALIVLLFILFNSCLLLTGNSRTWSYYLMEMEAIIVVIQEYYAL